MDKRKANQNWTVTDNNGSATFDGAQLAVLMDIRDELQTLNRLLGCPNFVAVPSILRGIRAKMPTRRRRLTRDK